MVFKKVKQHRVYQRVVEQIQESILNGEISPGTVLQGERYLAETFGVSRGAIREALRVLEQKGLIEIKVGIKGGAVVKTASNNVMRESLDILIRSQKIELRQIGEFREGVEGLVAGLAAQRATALDIAHLKALLAKAQRYYKEGLSRWEELLKVGLEIHMAIAQITRNAVYISIHHTIHENIYNYHLSCLPASDHLFVENFTDLKNIVDAVIMGESDKAKELARNHVHRFSRYMEKNVTTGKR